MSKQPVISADVGAQLVAALAKAAEKPAAAAKPAKEKSKAAPPAEKPAEAKAATAAAVMKEEKSPKKVLFLPKPMPADRRIHVLRVNRRPSLGRALFAHTHAALSILGMLPESRPTVPASDVLTVMGQRALSWHLSEGNFADVRGGIRLTQEGRNKFLTRGIDTALANEYTDMFLTGKPGKTGMSAADIFPVQLAELPKPAAAK